MAWCDWSVLCGRRKVGDPEGMQDYIERQLTQLHYAAVDNNFPNKFFAFCLTVLFAFLLPYLHIGVYCMACSWWW